MRNFEIEERDRARYLALGAIHRLTDGNELVFVQDEQIAQEAGIASRPPELLCSTSAVNVSLSIKLREACTASPTRGSSSTGRLDARTSASADQAQEQRLILFEREDAMRVTLTKNEVKTIGEAIAAAIKAALEATHLVGDATLQQAHAAAQNAASAVLITMTPAA